MKLWDFSSWTGLHSALEQGGVLLAKIMNKLSKTPINPLIGAAGVSAVPMAARVVNKVSQEYNSQLPFDACYEAQCGWSYW